MRELKLVCPCCGRHFIIAAELYAEPDLDQSDEVWHKIGLEFGVMKGGEEIGD